MLPDKLLNFDERVSRSVQVTLVSRLSILGRMDGSQQVFRAKWPGPVSQSSRPESSESLKTVNQSDDISHLLKLLEKEPYVMVATSGSFSLPIRAQSQLESKGQWFGEADSFHGTQSQSESESVPLGRRTITGVDGRSQDSCFVHLTIHTYIQSRN